ncbi:AraC family transcriptional regulator [Paenibacillus campi]|uniref:AraC family transcriptional regulator n=1 Tax=Paenibacillus campi TaxID=3106031 RepID=UPI002AFFD73C|nr:AraC family transcriptional regulator [Paenibacillus sp. SGZ-1014]
MQHKFYQVAPNPVFHASGSLYVLFTGESQTAPAHRLGPKIYDYYLYHYVAEGRGQFITEDHTYKLSSGDSFLIHPGQLVSYVSDQQQPWHYHWVAFAGEQADELVQQAGFRADASVARRSQQPGLSEIGAYLGAMLQAFYTQKDSSDLAALGYLHLIMAAASEQLTQQAALPGAESVTRRTVKQMIHYMSSQYAHPVSIEHMCSSIGYNRAYMSRIFKKETGMTPVTYLLKLRIDKARQLLRERPELSTQQIAASVGLTDALYFSKQFRRFYGVSPSQYRISIQPPG